MRVTRHHCDNCYLNLEDSELCMVKPTYNITFDFEGEGYVVHFSVRKNIAHIEEPELCKDCTESLVLKASEEIKNYVKSNR